MSNDAVRTNSGPRGSRRSISQVLGVPSGDADTDPAPALGGLYLSHRGSTLLLSASPKEQESTVTNPVRDIIRKAISEANLRGPDWCEASGKNVPLVVQIGPGPSYKAPCIECGRSISVTVKGLYRHHKATS